MRKRFGAVFVALLLVPMLAACGDDTDTATDETTTTAKKENVVDVEAKDYSFGMATTAEAGLLTFNFRNTGKEPHVFNLLRLDAGKGVADVVTALSSEQPGPPPPWAHPSGGIIQDPGKTTTYSSNFEPGTYVAYCPIPSPDGKAHYSKGMVAQFTLTGGAKGELPAAETTVTAKDFTWDGLQTLKAGEQTVKFVNIGKEPHEAAMFELAPGKTVKDLTKFFSSQGPPSGPPPFVGVAGLAGEHPVGQDAVIKFSLKAGTNYGVVCFIGNQKGPHFLQGMATDVKIA